MAEPRNKNAPALMHRVVAELKRDKKKTVVLGILVILAAVVGGRLLVRSLSPRQAGAAESPLAAARGGEGAKAGDADDAPPDLLHLGERAAHTAQRPGRRDHEFQRDLFARRPEFYPIEQPEKEATKVVAKSEPSADEKRRAAERLVRSQARSLSLQSTVVSSTPTAIINGRVLRTGDWINGFEITEITPRGCTVRKDGVDVQLQMSP